MRKEGSALDLAIAVAIALAEIGGRAPEHSAFLGELALDGAVRHVDGVLVAVRGLKKAGFRSVFVPATDASEAALVEGIEVVPCVHLAEVVAHVLGHTTIVPQPFTVATADSASDVLEHDLAEVHGQEEARRAIEVAAAGGHHILLSGPPGAGKTMLARCFPGILPPLEAGGAFEGAQPRRLVRGPRPRRPLAWARPLPAPHHGVPPGGPVRR